MKLYNTNNFLMIVVGLMLSFLTTGCSFQLEVGYHGKTGRDDHKVTESFVNEKKGTRFGQ